MSILEIFLLVLLSPVAIKILDRSWYSFKESSIYKDLLEEERKDKTKS